MGFLGGLVRAIGRTVGRGVEKVGDFFGSDKISDIGLNLQMACAEKVASEKSYDKKEANIYTTNRLNEVLVSFSEGYFQYATALERKCIRLVEDYCAELIKPIENAPDNVYSAADIKVLKRGVSRIAKTISGAITEPLAKRMSLDNSECLRILKMDSGIEKKQAMTNFSKKVIKESLNSLANNVRKALTDQTRNIEEYLSSKSEEQEKATQVAKERIDKMIKDNELEQSDKEKECVIPLLLVDVSNCVFDILK